MTPLPPKKIIIITGTITAVAAAVVGVLIYLK